MGFASSLYPLWIPTSPTFAGGNCADFTPMRFVGGEAEPPPTRDSSARGARDQLEAPRPDVSVRPVQLVTSLLLDEI